MWLKRHRVIGEGCGVTKLFCRMSSRYRWERDGLQSFGASDSMESTSRKKERIRRGHSKREAWRWLYRWLVTTDSRSSPSLPLEMRREPSQPMPLQLGLRHTSSCRK